MTRAPVVLVEFNELCPDMLVRFMGAGALPNFRRFFESSQVYTTAAGEKPPNLEPWIQWITVHTGLRLEGHGVFHLGDAGQMSGDWIWDHVSRAGGSNWICGSMNAAYGPEFRGLFLPDPWTARVAPNDARLQPYYAFVQEQVQEHTRAKAPVRIGAAAAFARSMAASGLSASTVAFGLQQLLQERIANVRWRRPALMDRMQLDLFCHYYRKLKPDFATFFSNSTAHYQHVYWRFMDPAPFTIKPTDRETRELGGAILWGYTEMDRMLGRIVSLARERATIVFATGLSQQPCPVYEAGGGKTFYRAIDLAKLLQFAGIDPQSCSVEPVMSEEFFLRFGRAELAAQARERLVALSVAGNSAFKARLEGDAVFAGCTLFTALPRDARLHGSAGSAPFFELMYGVDILKSGMHHPDGALWIREPGGRHQQYAEPVALERVAPTILGLLGLTVPEELPEPLPGAVAAASRPRPRVAAAVG